MTVTTLNRVISWPFTIGVAGLFAPMLHRPTDWVASVLSAIPAASIILLSVSFGCHTRQVPLRVPSTAGRCDWAAVVSFGISGPAVVVVRN